MTEKKVYESPVLNEHGSVQAMTGVGLEGISSAKQHKNPSK